MDRVLCDNDCKCKLHPLSGEPFTQCFGTHADHSLRTHAAELLQW